MDYKEILGIENFPEPKPFLFKLLKDYKADFVQITIDQLEGYKIIPEPEYTPLPPGCYIRYMPKYNHDLKAGGFVIDQVNHVITLASDGKIWKVNTKKCFVFIKRKTKIQKSNFRKALDKIIADYEENKKR